MTMLIRMTVYMTVTALILLAFKNIFKEKLSAKWQVWIWLFLFIRLVVPALPQSDVSIFNAVPGEVIYMDELPTPVQLPTETKPTATVVDDNAKTDFHAEDIFVYIWLAGAALMFVYLAGTNVAYRLEMRKGKLCENAETLAVLNECKAKLGVKGNIEVVNLNTTPALVGMLKPRIVIPEGYTLDEQKDIFIHELCHLKGGDIIAIWVAAAVLALNWFNPVMWYSFFVFRRDIEVYCDSRALMHTDDKKKYAQLLVKTALKKNRFALGTTALQNGEKEVQRRVKYMAYFKKPKVVWSVIIALIAVVISALCLTNSTASIKMSDQRFVEFSERMVGSTMAEIAYADEEKVVFYYIDGIFVYDLESEKIASAYDLSKLNCAQHQQGSFGLDITATADGREVYLINYGLEDEIGEFDNYVVNLENGKYKKTDLLKAENPFTGRRDSFEVIPDAKGWFSVRCVELDEEIIYLTNRTSTLKNMKIVMSNKENGLEWERYPFIPEFNNALPVAPSDIKELVSAKLILADGTEHLLEDETKLKRLAQMLGDAQESTPSGCPFDTTLILTRADGVRGRITLASDSCGQFIGKADRYYDYGTNNLRLLRLFGVDNWLGQPVDTLYEKTELALYKAFSEKYTPYYEILDLSISHWTEISPNEANFFYKMTHKNYDKDPDTVPYIKEAKERGEYIYETYKKEYLEPKTGMYDLKVVEKDGKLSFFANVAGKGEEWIPFEVTADSKNEYMMELMVEEEPRLFQWPCPSSREVSREFSGQYNHAGIDIKANLGENVVSAIAGTVTDAGFIKEKGNFIEISDGAGTVTRYYHLSEIITPKGTAVGRNMVIGKVGNTGISTGPHLEFQIIINGEWVDPMVYFK